MIHIEGDRLYGEIDRVPGVFRVETVFSHLNFFPIWPRRSVIVLERVDDHGEKRGLWRRFKDGESAFLNGHEKWAGDRAEEWFVPTRWSWRSVRWGYFRAIIGVMLMFSPFLWGALSEINVLLFSCGVCVASILLLPARGRFAGSVYSVLLGLTLACYLYVARQAPQVPSALVLAFGFTLCLATFYRLSRRLTHARPARALELAHEAGIDPEVVRSYFGETDGNDTIESSKNSW